MRPHYVSKEDPSSLSQYLRDSFKSLTTKWRRNCTLSISRLNTRNRNIQSRNTYKATGQQCPDTDCRHCPSSLQSRHTPLVVICIVYPERTGDSISVPAGEKSRGDSNQEVKDRYSNSQDESSGIHDED